MHIAVELCMLMSSHLDITLQQSPGRLFFPVSASQAIMFFPSGTHIYHNSQVSCNLTSLCPPT